MQKAKTHELPEYSSLCAIVDCDAWPALCALFLSCSKSSSRGDGGLRRGGGFRVDRGVDVVEATTDDELSGVDVLMFGRVGRGGEAGSGLAADGARRWSDVERGSGWVSTGTPCAKAAVAGLCGRSL